MKFSGLAKGILLLLCILPLSYLAPSAFGQNRVVDVNEGFEQESFLVPYPFYNEHIDFAVGLAGGFVGRPQEQMTSFLGITRTSLCHPEQLCEGYKSTRMISQAFRCWLNCS